MVKKDGEEYSEYFDTLPPWQLEKFISEDGKTKYHYVWDDGRGRKRSCISCGEKVTFGFKNGEKIYCEDCFKDKSVK